MICVCRAPNLLFYRPVHYMGIVNRPLSRISRTLLTLATMSLSATSEYKMSHCCLIFFKQEKTACIQHVESLAA